ncbi:hypothetical protein HDV02_001684 [Globomyces sp. JEL0801]|nr:hypothetical protein HDV02_001684 [Globomyces sp. JEL0801]
MITDLNVITEDSLSNTVKEYFNQFNNKNKGIVVVMTGSFFPVHQQHVEMWIKSKETLESKGYNVLILICPTTYQYVEQKLGYSMAKFCKPLLENNKSFELVCKSVQGIRSDGFFVSDIDFQPQFSNYNKTTSKIRSIIQSTNDNIKVYYLAGEDNFHKHMQRYLTDKGPNFADGLVVVRRPVQYFPNTYHKCYWLHYVTLASTEIPISSSLIRKQLLSGNRVDEYVPDTIKDELHELFRLNS